VMERNILNAIDAGAPADAANCRVVVQSAQAAGNGLGGDGGVTIFTISRAAASLTYFELYPIS